MTRTQQYSKQLFFTMKKISAPSTDPFAASNIKKRMSTTYTAGPSCQASSWVNKHT